MSDPNPFEWLYNWEKMVKTLEENNITSYKIDPNANTIEFHDGVAHVAPEWETIIAELLKENTQ